MGLPSRASLTLRLRFSAARITKLRDGGTRQIGTSGRRGCHGPLARSATLIHSAGGKPVIPLPQL
jgi:hypothetical protein